MKYDDTPAPEDVYIDMPTPAKLPPPCLHLHNVTGDAVPVAYKARGASVLYVACQSKRGHFGDHRATYRLDDSTFVFEWPKHEAAMPALLAQAALQGLEFDESGYFKHKATVPLHSWLSALPIIAEPPKFYWIPPTA